MSLKNSAMVVAAALALGVTVASNASPVCENLLNDLNVTSYGIAEVDVKGRVMVIVGITTGGTEVMRPVCDSKGDVRIFGGPDSAVTTANRAGGSAVVKFVRMARTSGVGDPVAALKSKHKAFKSEALSAGKQVTLLAGKLAAGVGLGWDVAVGTPEAAEYGDLLARKASIDEWSGAVSARVVTLEAALVAVGIDPATYLPIP